MNDLPQQTVLIVDDEELVLRIACDEFEDAGYRVVAASDGTAALDALERLPDIKLLFTDIRMPGPVDGWQLARTARSVHPQISVIYATGYIADAPQLVDGALFFTKPYRLAQVVKAAGDLLNPR